jgi:hypothetical protein
MSLDGNLFQARKINNFMLMESASFGVIKIFGLDNLRIINSLKGECIS